jgi:hypothetical protein
MNRSLFKGCSGNLVGDVDITVWLGGVATILPANLAGILDATVGSTAALKRVVALLRAVDPRLEKGDMAIGTAGAGTKGTNEVSGLEVVPRDSLGDFGQGDG